MDRSKEKPGQSGQLYTLDDDCCIILDSSSDEECEEFEAKKEMKKKASYVVIHSEFDDENAHEKQKAEIYEISDEDEILEEFSGTEAQSISTQDPPIVFIDGDDGDEILEEFSGTEAQSISTQDPPIVFIDDDGDDGAGSGRKCGPSKKKPRIAKEQLETGRSACKISGCFLLGLENSKRYSGKNFNQKKDELVQKIYKLFNSTVFDQKLPENMEITWNKKLLRTAGSCTISEIEYPKKERCAKIEISLKVCDSADRLRDTLIHEMCHAASWLLDGIQDFHGATWKFYARKANMVHPELPRVTRCHNYKINYRIHYECTQCKLRVGRYTRSLNTDRSICARCRGSLVMLPLTRKDGTPIKPHVRPFAKYVQENYRKVLQESAGISHGDVMKKLSKDYVASKQKKNH